MPQHQSQTSSNLGDSLTTPSLSPEKGGIFAGYQAPGASFDEIFEPSGAVRPHWKRLVENWNRVGGEELDRRWNQSQRLIHENGIAYSAYGDPTDKPRPWQLDALPVAIPHSQWTMIADGLRQRAKLFECILQDLYGPQRLLQRGLLPAEVIFRHPGFRRSYWRSPAAVALDNPAGNSFLHSYAADLARGPNGNWWILADRTEAPSGAGFALENRVVMSRMFPSLFRQSNVERLAPYFITLQQTVRHLAPKNRDNPRVVILSQGTGSANYFEDAYLARYLGYTLVDGDDLAVRNNEVFLKTLGGLLPVDVVMRRPNSEACDPLELDGHHRHGTPGLLQSERAGRVAVINSLGSGLVESPVFMAFLPAICQNLFGEALKLPGVATWWCGDPSSLEYVAPRLDQLVIKRAFRGRGHGKQAGEGLQSLSSERLLDAILADPAGFVAQERVSQSVVPKWQGGRVESSHVVWRTYLIRDFSQEVQAEPEFAVMNGALARTSSISDSIEVSLQAGEGSKDTWILADGPVAELTLMPSQTEVARLVRSRADLPSRVADNLFWLGRHVERADAAARLLRTVCVRLTSEADATRAVDLPFLFRCLAEQGQIEPGFVVQGMRDKLPSVESSLAAIVFDSSQPGSLRATLDEVSRVAAKVRDRLSVDTWRIVVQLDSDFRKPTAELVDLSDVLDMTNELIVDLAAIGGIVMESMTRTQAFRFLDLGRRLERALQIISLVQSSFIGVPSFPIEVLESVLEIADSRMTYRSRYLANLQLPMVLDLLLTDETNPRSVAFQLSAISEHVANLPRQQSIVNCSPEQRLAMSALNDIRMTEIEAVCEAYALHDQGPLQSLLETLVAKLPALSTAVAMRYLVHAGPAKQLGAVVPHGDD